MQNRESSRPQEASRVRRDADEERQGSAQSRESGGPRRGQDLDATGWPDRDGRDDGRSRDDDGYEPARPRNRRQQQGDWGYSRPGAFGSYEDYATEPDYHRGARTAQNYGDWGRPFDSSDATRSFEHPGRSAPSARERWRDEQGNGQRESHRGKGPKGFSRSDERLREEVSETLTDDHDVDASGIEVTVKDGEVTLDGYVDSRAAKRRAEDCAEDVSGVKHVQNNLRVKDRRQEQSGSAEKQS
jgi:hypothetical protein